MSRARCSLGFCQCMRGVWKTRDSGPAGKGAGCASPRRLSACRDAYDRACELNPQSPLWGFNFRCVHPKHVLLWQLLDDYVAAIEEGTRRGEWQRMLWQRKELRRTPLSPVLRMSRSTVYRATSTPSRNSSSQTLRAP